MSLGVHAAEVRTATVAAGDTEVPDSPLCCLRDFSSRVKAQQHSTRSLLRVQAYDGWCGSSLPK